MSGLLVFTAMARTIQNECHALQLVTPTFRTGPRSGLRTFRVREDGSAVVTVSIAALPDQMVAWDLALGVCAVNKIVGWPAALLAAALAGEAMAGALPERTQEALRSGKVIDTAACHV